MELKSKRSVLSHYHVLEIFYISTNDRVPLLGLQTCMKLNLIKRIDEVNFSSKDQIISNYKAAFTGLGCCQNDFHISLKSDAIPVSKPSRRIPISLKEPLKRELKRLCDNNVIEKVNGTTDWISNIVVIEKPNKLRICLDPKHLNLAIRDNFYEIPTFDDIKSKFANKNFFSVFDIKDGFLQVKLDEASQNLCSFSTPFGIFKYKRLPFGLKIAAEVFQKINEQNFGDIPNTT